MQLVQLSAQVVDARLGCDGVIRPCRFGGDHIQLRGLAVDGADQRRPFLVVRGERAIAVDAGLQFAKTFVQLGLDHWRRQIADERRCRAALGYCTFRRVVGRV